MTKMANKDAMEEVLYRNIGQWTQWSTIMDAFAKRALTSPRLVRPAVKFVRKSLHDQDDENKGEPAPLDFPHPALE